MLLPHGTADDNAERIAKPGFDDRLTKRALYGHGVYLAIDSCKAARARTWFACLSVCLPVCLSGKREVAESMNELAHSSPLLSVVDMY